MLNTIYHLYMFGAIFIFQSYNLAQVMIYDSKISTTISIC